MVMLIDNYVAMQDNRAEKWYWIKTEWILNDDAESERAKQSVDTHSRFLLIFSLLWYMINLICKFTKIITFDQNTFD